jgi:hypothetical protein
MQNLSKTDMKCKAKNEISRALAEFLETRQKQDVTDVPMPQQEEYKEVLDAQCERVHKFLGF